jgi:glycosyltransferase involved in cell wall biosynthesis
MHTLRVAIVAPSLRILGGQAIQADQLIRGWKNDADVRAWLVPINPAPPKYLRWTRDVKYARTLVTESLYTSRLLPQLRGADVVHVFSASYWSFLLAPVPAIAAAKALGLPVVLNYHSGEAPDHLRRSAVARAVMARVDRNVVPSGFLVDVLKDFGIASSAIGNVVDLGRFQFRERRTFAPRILSTRNFEALYNVACTIRAFRRIQDRHPDAALTLVGGGSQERALKTLAADLNLKNVVFTGRLRPENVDALRPDHDIYLQSPNIDNMPLSVLEAFATGAPVVTTDVGGIAYMVRHLHNGMLAPADDDEALAVHALRLIDEPALGQAIVRNALAYCEALTWPTLRGQWLGLYRDVVATSSARRTFGSAGDASGHVAMNPPSGPSES